jgi:hypothetical protein
VDKKYAVPKMTKEEKEKDRVGRLPIPVLKQLLEEHAAWVAAALPGSHPLLLSYLLIFFLAGPTERAQTLSEPLGCHMPGHLLFGLLAVAGIACVAAGARTASNGTCAYHLFCACSSRRSVEAGRPLSAAELARKYGAKQDLLEVVLKTISVPIVERAPDGSLVARWPGRKPGQDGSGGQGQPGDQA